MMKRIWLLLFLTLLLSPPAAPAGQYPLPGRDILKLESSDVRPAVLNRQWFWIAGTPAEGWQDAVPANATPVQLTKSRIDLDAVTGRQNPEGAEGVLYNEFEADEDGIMQLGIGCDWWFEAFCNGIPCYTTFPGGNDSPAYVPADHPFLIPVKAGRNRLAVRVRRGSQSWQFACGMAPFRLPEMAAIQYGPWISNPDAGRMSIRFGTAGHIGSGIEFRRHGGRDDWQCRWDQRHGQILRRKFHAIHLPNLEEGARYDYRVVMIDPDQPEQKLYGDTHTFRVPDSRQTDFSFFFTADLQFPPEQQLETLDRLLAAAGGENCDFLVFGGDIGSNFDSIENDLLKLSISRLVEHGGAERPLVMLRGNHELRGKEADRFLDYFGTPEGHSYDIFRFGDTAFLMLDAWEDKPAASQEAAYCKYNLDELFFQEQEAFLAEALASEKWLSAKRHIVLAHGAPYSHNEDYMPQMLRKLTNPYFGGQTPPHRLNLWLAAHTHRYSRSIPGTNIIAAPEAPPRPQRDGENYRYPVMTGAGPSPYRLQASAFRIDATADKLTVSAFAPDGNCFDKVEIANDGTITELLPLPHFGQQEKLD